jgi:hypothetical protein
MKPIWYFVGLLLLAMGVIVLSSGIYAMFYPPAEQRVLSQLHPDIWWGVVMVVGGGIFTLANRKKTV